MCPVYAKIPISFNDQRSVLNWLYNLAMHNSSNRAQLEHSWQALTQQEAQSHKEEEIWIHLVIEF